MINAWYSIQKRARQMRPKKTGLLINRGKGRGGKSNKLVSKLLLLPKWNIRPTAVQIYTSTSSLEKKMLLLLIFGLPHKWSSRRRYTIWAKTTSFAAVAICLQQDRWIGSFWKGNLLKSKRKQGQNYKRLSFQRRTPIWPLKNLSWAGLMLVCSQTHSWNQEQQGISLIRWFQ